jgi:hypothetical protein
LGRSRSVLLDALGSEAFEERVEPSDGQRDPARAAFGSMKRQACSSISQSISVPTRKSGALEEPRVPIDAGVEIGYRDTGE